jgi:hypothetical protein
MGRLDTWGIGVQFLAGERDFSLLCTIWGSPSLMSDGYQNFFHFCKLAGAWNNHSPPSSADIKNTWSYTSTSPNDFVVWYLIKKYTITQFQICKDLMDLFSSNIAMCPSCYCGYSFYWLPTLCAVNGQLYFMGSLSLLCMITLCLTCCVGYGGVQYKNEYSIWFIDQYLFILWWCLIKTGM